MPLPLQNVNIESSTSVVSPIELIKTLPVPEDVAKRVVRQREDVKRILSGEDKRIFVIVGPCSIHNHDIAVEYATLLSKLATKVEDRLLVVMRVYFEKPRTTVGWKGLINDPFLDGTFDMGAGVRMARETLLEVAKLGLPVATEMLEPITPQFIADLVTVASIGARTTESPTHRQMSSGLSMPVGFKNSTEGSLEVAINAMNAAEAPHSFLGIDGEGKICVLKTKGNPWGHLILRGGRTGPNYDSASLANAVEMLGKANLSPRFVVDCSHANSNKDYSQQAVVWNDVIDQRMGGNDAIIGLMLESNLQEGKQSLPEDLSQLKHGVSITDGCIGWEETESLILGAFEKLA
jgi:3-deoxy-7-phosphoheptulonate synthase